MAIFKSDGLNVLRALDAQSPMLFDNAAGCGEALIKLESKDPHWSVRSRGLVTGLTMAEVIDAAVKRAGADFCECARRADRTG